MVEADATAKQKQQQRPILGYKSWRQKALVVDDKEYNRPALV
jgi:hypothetical protein